MSAIIDFCNFVSVWLIANFSGIIPQFYTGTDNKRGCSALTIQRHIKVNYKTAWLMLHKMRHAMARQDQQYLLDGIIQLDEAYFGGPNGKQGRGTEKAVAFVAISTGISDKQATAPLFAKIKVCNKLSMKTVKEFVDGAIEPGSQITTDSLKIYNSLNDNGFKHDKFLSGSPECNQALDWAHTIISNAKTFILGTYHGLAQCHLQAYLDEYCYRLNRRKWVNQLFPRLLNACVSSSTFTLAELTG